MPLAQPRIAERERVWSVLQTALRLAPQPFGRHVEPTGLNVSGLSPRGTAMLAASSRKHIALRGPARGGPALGPQIQ